MSEVDTWALDLYTAVVRTSGKVNALRQKPKPRFHSPPRPPGRSLPFLFLPCCLARQQSLYNFTFITIRTRSRTQVLEVRRCDLESLK